MVPSNWSSLWLRKKEGHKSLRMGVFRVSDYALYTPNDPFAMKGEIVPSATPNWSFGVSDHTPN